MPQVFHVEQYKQLQQEAQARRTARQRYLAALKALEREHAGAKAAAAAEKANGNGGLPTQQPPPPDDMQPADSMLIETHPSIELPPGVVAAQAAAAAHPSRRRLLQAHVSQCCIDCGGVGMRLWRAGGLRGHPLTPTVGLPLLPPGLQRLGRGTTTYQLLKDTLKVGLVAAEQPVN